MSQISHPKHIDNYEVLEILGQGGMGIVYRARDSFLGREVAIKIPLGDLTAKQLSRIQDEATLMAKVQHKHILQVLTVGSYNGRTYIVTPVISGGTLKDRINELPNDPRRAARILAYVARGVAAAHAVGIIHRDLKPANIFIDVRNSFQPGHNKIVDKIEHPLVADFGLARPLHQGTDQTTTRGITGTPEYLAPEQAEEKPLTTAVDVYALGAVLYTCLTGKPPFHGDNFLGILSKILLVDPVPPKQINTKVDADLEAICMKCLRKNADERYESANELADDLTRWLNKKYSLKSLSSETVGVTADILEARPTWYHSPVIDAAMIILALVLGIRFCLLVMHLSETYYKRDLLRDDTRRLNLEWNKSSSRNGHPSDGSD